MAEDKRVVVRHADGREYSIPEKSFDDDKAGPEEGTSYKEAGFKVTSWESGEPYKAPAAKKD